MKQVDRLGSFDSEIFLAEPSSNKSEEKFVFQCTLYICDYMSNILCTMLWREDRSEHKLIGTKVLH